MNTSAVAKLLGVSSSTIQRWVKLLELHMERNELGHYSFTDEDIQLLKEVKEQLNTGVLLQDVTVEKRKIRKGAAKIAANDQLTARLMEKINHIELRLNQKADDVVSYQLLQHRREIEEIQQEIKNLHAHINQLEEGQKGLNQNIPTENLHFIDQETPKKKMKRKNLIASLFSF
ncbi:chromosome-anchoring protein RacA [Cytobacillus eiseniae]|uniref:Chromosome-anchoring protein RacA n=1 Tax=Cytobacillus eiseniae TaxID=762947 RepID=A0ABS4RDL4_9BACI|nr:MerR family transcriptional regulator [Cytobacillus eiseniae]MBP2240465.1 chromosome-anchoring protein RacA [Cytobacillus eiseniae]